jgi:hypothetical protein
MSEITQALFVAWQHPQTRRFHPVARLARVVEETCDHCFEFAYIRGALQAQAAGFQPFLAFPNLNQVYRSRDLFPTFANRLMSESRLDYPLYLERLGLALDQAHPLDVLGRSGGSRATDAVELFPLPSFNPVGGGYTTYFFAHAVRHLFPEAHERVGRLRPTEQLLVMFDCQNRFDAFAIALRTEDRIIVGYMPSYLLEGAFALYYNCGSEYFQVFVERVNPPPAPMQQRLLCRLEACWPDNFVPFSSERYQPLEAEAVRVRPAVQATPA